MPFRWHTIFLVEALFDAVYFQPGVPINDLTFGFGNQCRLVANK